MIELIKKTVWQAQAENNVEAWEIAVLKLKEAEYQSIQKQGVPHLALYESLQALFYIPGFRKSAAHILLAIAEEFEAASHRQAIRCVVGYYFEVQELNIGAELNRTKVLKFSGPLSQTRKPCAVPPH